MLPNSPVCTPHTPPDSHTGFDVALGNPPWDQIQFDDLEFFAVKRPDIVSIEKKSKRKKEIERIADTNPSLYDDFVEAQSTNDCTKQFVHESGLYELTSVGRLNTAPLFAELATRIVSQDGRAGIITPTGIATDYYNQGFFNSIVDNRELVSLYDFENREALFHGVDSRMKFCLLTLTGTGAPEQAIDFASFLTQPEQLADEERRFTLTREELYAMNPNTGTCPVFRTKRDAELTKKIYRSAEVLVNEAEEANPWGASFNLMFMMNTDSHLFHRESDLEEEGFKAVSNVFKNGEEEFLPLYEAKMLHQFDHRFASYRDGDITTVEVEKKENSQLCVRSRYWVHRDELPERHGCWLAFRDIARTTDVRTGIFSVIPDVAVANSAPIIGTAEKTPIICCLLSEANSMSFDFDVRQKVGGTHLNFYIVKQLPVHPPERYTPELLEYIVPRVLELTYTAWDLAAFADDVWSESDAALQSAIEAQWQANAQATGGGHRGKTPPEWVEHSEQAEAPFPAPALPVGRRAPRPPPRRARRPLRPPLRPDARRARLHPRHLPHRQAQRRGRTRQYRTKRLVLEAYDALAGKEMLEAPEEALKE